MQDFVSPLSHVWRGFQAHKWPQNHLCLHYRWPASPAINHQRNNFQLESQLHVFFFVNEFKCGKERDTYSFWDTVSRVGKWAWEGGDHSSFMCIVPILIGHLDFQDNVSLIAERDHRYPIIPLDRKLRCEFMFLFVVFVQK